MKSTMKKLSVQIMAFVLALLMVPIIAVDVNAASYPSIFPDDYSMTATQGEEVALKYTIFHEFKNEAAYINVHKGSRTGPIVATADRDFYNSYTTTTTWTVKWDTSDVEPGTYYVEYYMKFYSLYSWHETPNRSFHTIEIKAAPCKNGHTYDAGKVSTAPTCKATGVKKFTCTICGDVKKETLPKTEHIWNTGVITTQAGAVTEGVKTFTCSVCKDTRTEIIPAIFKDVTPGVYYAPAIDWAYKTGVTTGTSATTFSPEASCTRGQVVTFLWRASGSPEPKTTQNPFTDVQTTDYFYKPVLWAVEQGITTGTSATTFTPEQPCSNAHILTFLWRSQGKPDATGAGTWYTDAVNWASINNILEDTTAASNVEATCPRSSVVTFLYRVLDEEASAALKHTYGEWKVKTKATCSTEGSETRTCTKCGFKQTRATAKAPHSLSAATCTQPQTCSVCKATVGSAKGHTWTNATCSRPATCTTCGATNGAALPHNYVNGVCSVCNSKNPNYIKQNQVYKDSKVIISFKEVTSKGVVFEVENLTNVNITFQADAMSINKKSTEDFIMSDDVAAGCIGEITLRCDFFDPNEKVGIMSGQFRYFDSNNWSSTCRATFCDVVIDSDVIVSEPAVPKTLLYSDSKVKIYYHSVDSTGIYYTVQNLTDKCITIQADSVSLNKRSVDSIIMSDSVAPHSTGIVKARCTPPATTGIQFAGGTLRIFDSNDWSSTFRATFVNVPVVN